MIPIEGPANAAILVLGDCPTDSDEKSGRPFMGQTGTVLDSLMREAGISRAEVMLTTIARDKPPGGRVEFFFNDDKFAQPKPYWEQSVQQTKELIERVRPNIIIALGPIAMFYLTGFRGINDFRGYIVDCSLVPGTKVLTTYHPKTVNLDWNQAFTVVMDFRKAIRNSHSPYFPADNREMICNPGLSEFKDYCNFLVTEHKEPVVLDIENRQPETHIHIVGFADSANRGMSMSLLNGNQPKFSLQQELEFWESVARVCANCELIMQNGNHDRAVLWLNTKIACLKYNYDVMLAAHAVWPEAPRSLGYLASVCLNVPPWKHTANENEVLYNAGDVCNTYGVWNVLEKQMERTGTRKTHDFEIRQSPVAVLLQLQGVLIDREKQEQLLIKSNSRILQLESELEQKVGRRINYNAHQQLQNLLYGTLGLPPQYARKKNAKGQNPITAGAEALVALGRMFPENDILGKVLELKKHLKLLTFLDIPISPTNRVHTCYNTTGAKMQHEKKGKIIDADEDNMSFGRWSSSASIILPYGSGNLQNIPPEARKMYDAGENKVFVQADYKQAEAVVVAWLIGDEKLKSMFRASFGLSEEECKARNLDIHKITAAGVVGVKVTFIDDETVGLVVKFLDDNGDEFEITGEMRKIGKTLRHATNYSAGPGVLDMKLGCGMKHAKKLLDSFAQSTPQLPVWQGRIVDELRATRILENLLGRKHKFMDRWGDSLFRSAYSFKPQSTVGDLLNEALIYLYDHYADELEIALQLHDAIYVIVEDSPDRIQFAKDALRDSMVTAVQPLHCNGEDFFIDIDYKVGRYWGDLKD